MYINVSFQTFADQFKAMGRADQFSYAGLRALFEHIEEIEEGTGEPMEIDVIALCVDFSEYTIDELLNERPEIIDGVEDWPELDDDEKQSFIVDELDDCAVIPVDNGSIIIQG